MAGTHDDEVRTRLPSLAKISSGNTINYDLGGGAGRPEEQFTRRSRRMINSTAQPDRYGNAETFHGEVH